MATHARQLDRHRFDRCPGAATTGTPPPSSSPSRRPAISTVATAGGSSPDLCLRASQPGGALHALEALTDAAPVAITTRARELCTWLAAVTLADGGLPFALPVPDSGGCAPFQASADPGVSSLRIPRDRGGERAPGRRTRPRPRRAPGVTGPPRAASLRCAVPARSHTPLSWRSRRGPWTPPWGPSPMRWRAGRAPPGPCPGRRVGARRRRGRGRLRRPLDLTARPGRPARGLSARWVVARELTRLAGQHQPDGG